MIVRPNTMRLRRSARNHFGWRTLRPAQLTAMRAIMKGRDALVVLPTGAGKSAVYQVPATLLHGPTVVISPLLALQQDQIAALNDRGERMLTAVRISSAESPKQQREAMEALRTNKAEYLFITPEQLTNPERLAEVRALRPSLIAIDEAHCISAWGHDFRPDYLQLGAISDELGHPPVVALTATASPPVREDIVSQLRLRRPEIVVSGLDRANLFLEAVHCPDDDYRWRRLLAAIRDETPPGIVYTPTRRGAEELAERLQGEGVQAQAYHGGMSAGERTRRHEDFLADRVPVMVATSAFGMGIDKPNIRWVYHTALPDSPDSYFQEIGRAGRDNAPARGLLLWRGEDVGLQRFFAGGAPDVADLSAIVKIVREQRGPVSRTKLKDLTGLGVRKLGQLLALLEQVGGVAVGRGGKLSVPRFAPKPAEAAEAALERHERHQRVQNSRLDMMRHFAESTQCRSQVLLAYFGEHLDRPCGHCDNCATGLAEEAEAAQEEASGPFPVHSQVTHTQWGAGMVLRYEGDRMVVLFDEVGYKTLSVAVVEEQGLLVPAEG